MLRAIEVDVVAAAVEYVDACAGERFVDRASLFVVWRDPIVSSE